MIHVTLSVGHGIVLIHRLPLGVLRESDVWQGYIWRSAADMAACLSMLWLVDVVMLREARATVQRTHAFPRVSRLLNSMCDSAVLVDDALCITEASSQLVGMLLQHLSRFMGASRTSRSAPAPWTTG